MKKKELEKRIKELEQRVFRLECEQCRPWGFPVRPPCHPPCCPSRQPQITWVGGPTWGDSTGDTVTWSNGDTYTWQVSYTSGDS